MTPAQLRSELHFAVNDLAEQIRSIHRMGLDSLDAKDTRTAKAAERTRALMDRLVDEFEKRVRRIEAAALEHAECCEDFGSAESCKVLRVLVTTSAQNGEVVMGIPTCLACKTPWGHTLDCPLVLGWRARAEKAEAEVVRLRYELDAALLHIRVLTGAGE